LGLPAGLPGSRHHSLFPYGTRLLFPPSMPFFSPDEPLGAPHVGDFLFFLGLKDFFPIVLSLTGRLFCGRSGRIFFSVRTVIKSFLVLKFSFPGTSAPSRYLEALFGQELNSSSLSLLRPVAAPLLGTYSPPCSRSSSVQKWHFFSNRSRSRQRFFGRAWGPLPLKNVPPPPFFGLLSCPPPPGRSTFWPGTTRRLLPPLFFPYFLIESFIAYGMRRDSLDISLADHPGSSGSPVSGV